MVIRFLSLCGVRFNYKARLLPSPFRPGQMDDIRVRRDGVGDWIASGVPKRYGNAARGP
jgi:hypothetical protein